MFTSLREMLLYRIFSLYSPGCRLMSATVLLVFLTLAAPASGQTTMDPGTLQESKGGQTSETRNDSADSGGEFSEFEEFGEFDETDQQEFFDPLEPYNRFMTGFNDKLYIWVLEPTARGYSKVVPEPARLSVKRFFSNLGYPIRLINNILQLKGRPAAEETFRFLINTTVGIGGLFDPASKLPRLDAHPEDFGQTLGYYGLGGGFPIVWPFLGPSNLRDSIGMVPDGYLDPVNYAGNTYSVVGARVYDNVNSTSLRLGEYVELKKDALDLYIFLRNAYESNRQKKIEE